jgi:hypothetical protein
VRLEVNGLELACPSAPKLPAPLTTACTSPQRPSAGGPRPRCVLEQVAAAKFGRSGDGGGEVEHGQREYIAQGLEA